MLPFSVVVISLLVPVSITVGGIVQVFSSTGVFVTVVLPAFLSLSVFVVPSFLLLFEEA
jgi:hypothetical protein